MGPFFYLGTVGGPFRPYASACGDRFRLCAFYWCRGFGTKRLGTRAFPFAGRHRNWWGVGTCWHLRGGGMARGSAQNGRGILANRVLLRIFYRRGAELYSWRAIWVASGVSMRSLARTCFIAYFPTGKRARAMEATD